MRLVYQPEGQDQPTEWAINLGKFRSLEIEAIERVTNYNYGSEFKERLLKGNALARRALLWTLQRRSHPTMKFADVDFADDELSLAFDLDELRDIRSTVADSDTFPEVDRATALAEIDKQIVELEEQPAEGKALTPTGDGDTE